MGQFTLSITILAGIHAIHLSMPLGKENKTTSEEKDGCKKRNCYCNDNVNWEEEKIAAWPQADYQQITSNSEERAT